MNHPSLAETLADPAPARGALQLVEPSHGRHRLFDGLHQEARHLVSDHLGHRTPAKRDDRGPAGHGLDDTQSEGLVEADGVQERRGTSEEQIALPGSHGADVGHGLAVDVGLDLRVDRRERLEWATDAGFEQVLMFERWWATPW